MTLTPTQLIELDGTPSRRESVRWDLLDVDLLKVGELHPDRARAVPRITNSTESALKRSVSSVLLPPDESADIDTIAARIRPSWVLQDGSEYPLGVFLFADASRSIFSFGDELSGTLVDQLFILDQELAASLSYPAGTIVTSALEDLAAQAGIVSRHVIPSTQQLSYPVAWKAGTSRLRAMTELATQIGYSSPYFDNTGTLQIVPAPNLATAMPTLTYSKGDVDEGRVYAETIVETDDLLRAPNLYVVIDNSATAGPIVGRYVVPASAPHSIPNRGFAVPRVVDLQGLTSSSDADAAAQALAAEDGEAFVWATFSAAPDPRHDTFDVVEFLGETYREIGWSLTCAPGGPHTHNLRRIFSGA